MSKVSPSSDWGVVTRIAVPFLIFVIMGSLGLGEWLQANFRRENRELFATLARTNADFIRSSHLPHSRQMATDLGRILDVRVYFRSRSGETVPPLRPEANSESIAVPLDQGSDLLLVRKAEGARTGLLRPATLLAFAVFWALTLALAAALTRSVVRPYLTALAELGAERAAREKAERLALLGKMATGLAHEIHNPLSGIRMHLQLLEKAEPPESVAIALGEITKIETLVNQWMFLVRPEPPQTSPAGLAALVGGVTRSLQPLAAHARVRLEAEISPELRIQADARRISQAIGNIVINGIQAMSGGGELRISARAAGRNVAVDFQDGGRGFTPEALQHYSDLFFSEKEGGMGIGLSVAAEIVKAHGGALRVGNSPGGGAVVTMELPSA